MRKQPEKAIQRSIIRALKDMGFWVMDLSQPRRTMLPLGLPDLLVMHRRWGALWIEVKTPAGRLSDHQRAWHEAARQCGQTVIVARSVADVAEWVEQAIRGEGSGSIHEPAAAG